MIELPFIPRFHDPVRSGAKTLTCRNKKFGAKGDLLRGPGCTLRLLDVYEVRLGVVAETLWKQEGCESPKDFIAVWNQIHPQRGYWPHLKVYAHKFEVAEVDLQFVDRVHIQKEGCEGCGSHEYDLTCPNCRQVMSYDYGSEGHMCGGCGYYDGYK